MAGLDGNYSPELCIHVCDWPEKGITHDHSNKYYYNRCSRCAFWCDFNANVGTARHVMKSKLMGDKGDFMKKSELKDFAKEVIRIELGLIDYQGTLDHVMESNGLPLENELRDNLDIVVNQEIQKISSRLL